MSGRTDKGYPTPGFTLVEVLVTVMAIAILAGIVVSSDRGFLERSRDVQRKNDISNISRALERYYRTNATVSGPTYPATSAGASGVAAIVDNSDFTNAPNQTTNSVVIAATNSTTQAPTVDQYMYQPLTSAGALCTSAPCVKYKMYYRQESDQTVVSIDSVRQQ